MGLFAGTPFDRPPHCPVCEKLEEACTCPPAEPERTPTEKQSLTLVLERRKNGKQVTVIRGLAPDTDFIALLKELKSTCGSGGTLPADIPNAIELQGDHRPRLATHLKSRGYKVRG